MNLQVEDEADDNKQKLENHHGDSETAKNNMSGAAVEMEDSSSIISAAVAGRKARWSLLAYGGLAMPLSLAGLPILTYLPAFYAQELRISPALVGVVFLCARLWDAVSNLVIGWLSDRSTSRWGRRKPWVVVGAPFLLVSTWYLCNPPQQAGLGYLAMWVAIFYTSWAAMYVPYLSWGTELTTEYSERNRVTSYREAFTMLGNLFFAAGPLIFLANGAPLRDVLLLMAVTVLLLVPPTVLPLSLCVTDQPPVLQARTHLWADLTSLRQDRVLIRFIIGTLVFALGEGVVNSMLVFFFTVGLHLQNGMFWALLILYVSTLCTVPLMLRVSRQVEKHRLLAAALTLQVVIYGIFVTVPQESFVMVAVLEAILGIANSTILVLPTSILADIIDHGEVTTGARRAGGYVAIYNLMLKVGMALGVGLAFGLLAVVNYDPSAARHSLADETHIRLLAFGLPALLQIPAVLLFLKHPITRQVQQQLRERIDLRQSALGRAL